MYGHLDENLTLYTRFIVKVFNSSQSIHSIQVVNLFVDLLITYNFVFFKMMTSKYHVVYVNFYTYFKVLLFYYNCAKFAVISVFLSDFMFVENYHLILDNLGIFAILAHGKNL